MEEVDSDRARVRISLSLSRGLGESMPNVKSFIPIEVSCAIYMLTALASVLLPSALVPEPAPISGQYTFPTKDTFPPPRPFVKGARLYATGSKRGSNFDVGIL